MTIHEQIARLEQTILRLHQHIEEIEKEFNKLSASDLPKRMEAKERELNHLQSKLLVCQQEKEAIQQALDEKVKELENSNLTKEEKAEQIIKLTENNRNELNSVSQKLEKYPAQEDKETVQEINLEKINQEREQTGETELLEGGELDLTTFKNLEEIEIYRKFLKTPITKLSVEGLTKLKVLI
ncbi:1172_t:CDS:2 [Paraglomus brasilianum]|uniref:1172_t:CDS:1 n=1 Tax=Paraglomus brasilianum TaxID=144538 RepID=A0A9N9FQ12_9GLOM|nr:1172_t:CDS:2 [Paraglomus brasilianum]